MKFLIAATLSITVLVILILPHLAHEEKLENRVSYSNEFMKASFHNLTSRLIGLDKILCNPSQNFQSCLDLHYDKVIITTAGHFEIKPFNLNSNQTLIISSTTTLKLSNDAEMPHKGGYVLGILGKPTQPINNIALVVDGVIDGNKNVHPYEKSGNECIRIDYAQNVLVVGVGIVRNCSGDGIDIDASSSVLVSGISSFNNSGAGLHVGSGRPIKASKNILAIGVTAKGNGFKVARAGLDASWPNYNSIIYLLSKSEQNYRNWGLEGAGSLAVLNNSSGGAAKDRLAGASIVFNNGQLHTSKFENIFYYYHLIRRDILIFLGRELPKYLTDLKYKRDVE